MLRKHISLQIKRNFTSESTSTSPSPPSKTVPPDTAALPSLSDKSWDTYFINERKEYRKKVKVLRKIYQDENYKIMAKFYKDRYDEWNRVQSNKYNNKVERVRKATISIELNNKYNKILNDAYRTLKLQKKTKRNYDKDRDMRLLLIMLSDMHNTSHRWIDSKNINLQLKPELFNYRLPINGLTPQRSIKDEAMIAFFSSNTHPDLPDSVFECLGLATESALRRKEERDAKLATKQAEAEALEKEELGETEVASEEPETSILSGESSESVDGEVKAETKTDDSKPADPKPPIPVKETVLTLAAKNKLKERQAMDDTMEEADSHLKRHTPEYDVLNSTDSYLIAGRFPDSVKDVSIQQKLSTLSLQNRHSLFPKSNSSISVAAEVMKSVGLNFPTEPSKRFELWYSYINYVYAMPEDQPVKYAQFLTLLLNGQNIPIIITEEDVRKINEATDESKKVVEEVAAELNAIKLQKIEEAGSYEKYLEEVDEEMLADADDSTVAKKMNELQNFKAPILEKVIEERKNLGKLPSPPLAKDDSSTTSGKAMKDAADYLRANFSNDLLEERIAAIKADNVLRDRTVAAVTATSPIASLSKSIQLSMSEGDVYMTPAQALRVKKAAIENFVGREKERALKAKAQTELAIKLEDSPSATNQAMHQINSMHEYLEEERRAFKDTQILNAKKRAALLKQKTPESAKKLAELESESNRLQLRREREELEAEVGLEQLTVQAEHWSDAELAETLANKRNERALKLESLKEVDEKVDENAEVDISDLNRENRDK